jgi:aryl-alcohol dehydrogenase-like predicted oxidoreductase
MAVGKNAASSVGFGGRGNENPKPFAGVWSAATKASLPNARAWPLATSARVGRTCYPAVVMEYRQLGRSGLKVSCLALGTASFGDTNEQRGAVDLRAARRQLDMALDAGVNLVDTADAYAKGAAETVVGRLLAGRRDRTLLATKARFPVGPGPNDAGSSRHHLVSACDASLRRLQTDHIDLYQLHEWDGQTPLEETLSALDFLVRSGKVRYVGCSNFAGWQVMKALGIAERRGLPPLVSNQVYLTLLERSAEYDIVPTALDQGQGLLIWSPLAGGLLSGKYRRGTAEPAGSRFSGGWPEPPVHDWEKLYDVVDVLCDIAAAHQVSGAQVALAWLLARPAVTSVVLGARTEAQLADNLAASALDLSTEERQRLEAISRPLLIYPYWHQRMWARDRLGQPELSLIGPHLEAKS